MWRIPVSLIAGGTETIVTIIEDTLIGNLWTFMGSPSGPQTVILTVDGADVGDVQITADWAGGSTFEIICINNGRLLGLGGDGGDGGDDFGASGSAGLAGGTGGHALTSDGFTVNLDIDDGFMFGAGGGGGGGGYSSTNNSPGGGGGGGQGFSVTTGGAAGSPTGTPIANPGQDGGQTGAGNGGAGGDVGNNDGGAAGTWGYGGTLGGHVAIRAGQGGSAGAAYFGSGTLVHSGAKNESQLVSEGRILGDIGFYISLPNAIINFAIDAGSKTGGFLFVNDSIGTLRKVNSISGNVNYTDWWAVGTVTPADFEVRDVVGTRTGTWTNDPTGAEGDWRTLDTASLQWDLVATGIDTVSQAFEIRRTSDSGGIVASGYLSVELSDFS